MIDDKPFRPSDAFDLFFKDDADLLLMIKESDHPACTRFRDWLVTVFHPEPETPAIRHMSGADRLKNYRWFGTRAEFDRMITEAIYAVRPVQ